jgi:competence protein ComK
LEFILPEYFANEQTNALLPTKQKDYRAIVLSAFEKYYVKGSPFDIVKASCERDFTTYEGRVDAVKSRTVYRKKLPTPINTARKIFAFPTMSPNHSDCIWLFYHRIQAIKELKSQPRNEHQSIVQFTDGSHLPLSISFYTLKKQYTRTAHCVKLYEEGMESDK